MEKATQQLTAIRELESESNPALASILVFKAFGLMKENPYVLWRVLQEKLGKSWFAEVLIDRSKNYKYAIDYEPIEDLLPTLNRMCIKDRPDKIDMLAGENANFIRYVVQTYTEQMDLCYKAMFNKDKLWRSYAEQGLTADAVIEADKGETAVVIDVDAGRRVDVNGVVDGVIKMSSADLDVDVDGSKMRKMETMMGKHMSQAQEKMIKEIEGLKLKNEMLKNELINAHNDVIGQSSLNVVLDKRLNLIILFLKDVFDKVGIDIDFQNLRNALDQVKKIDGKTLQILGIDRVIESKKIELLAKLAVQGTAIKNKVNKSTNTTTASYKEIYHEDPELMATLIHRIKTIQPDKGHSTYEGSKYSGSRRYGGGSSRLSKHMQAANDSKRKMASNFSLMRKGEKYEQGSYRGDQSYDGSLEGGMDGDDHIQASFDRGTTLQGSPRNYTERNQFPTPRHNNDTKDPVSFTGRHTKLNFDTTNTPQQHNQPRIPGTNLIGNNFEFPSWHPQGNKDTSSRSPKNRQSQLKRNDSIDHDISDHSVNMSVADRLRHQNEAGIRKMSLFVGHTQIVDDKQQADYYQLAVKDRSPNYQTSTELSPGFKAKKPRPNEGMLNNFFTVANIKDGMLLAQDKLPVVDTKSESQQKHESMSKKPNDMLKTENRAMIPNKSEEKIDYQNSTKNNLRPKDILHESKLNNRLLRKTSVDSNNIKESSRLPGKDGDRTARPKARQKIEVPDLHEDNNQDAIRKRARDTPDELEVGERESRKLSPKHRQLETLIDQSTNLNSNRSMSHKKKKKIPMQELYVLDAIQIAQTQDLDVGLYLKILPNTKLNHKLSGRKSKLQPAPKSNIDNFVIYLTRPPDVYEGRREAEMKLLHIIKEKTEEVEKLNSKYILLRHDHRRQQRIRISSAK